MAQKSINTAGGDGTAIPTGFVGKKLETTISTYRNYPATTTWEDAGGNGNGLTLGIGTWSMTMQVEATLNSASAPTSSYNVGISTTTGNSAAGLTSGNNRIDHAAPTSINNTSATIAQYVVDVASPTAYYGKVRAVFSSGNPQYVFRLTAVQIS